MNAARKLSPNEDVDILQSVMSVLVRNSRAYYDGACSGENCRSCHRIHEQRLARLVSRRLPIRFVVPAFPAKSPNRKKVIGSLPDLGEELALQHLQRMCSEIARLYEPGASIMICSDGHVFADLVGLTDQVVDDYFHELRRLIEEAQLDRIDLFSLRCVGFGEPDLARRVLVEEFGQSLEEIHEQVVCDPSTTKVFNGMSRFVFEDMVALQENLTRTALRKKAKALTYQMMQRSISWSNLVSEQFPDAVRLSVHPQSTHSPKFGVHLMSTGDNWLTPWHGTVLEVAGEFRLVKRHELDGSGASMVYKDNRPSHFQLHNWPSSLVAPVHDSASKPQAARLTFAQSASLMNIEGSSTMRRDSLVRKQLRSKETLR